VKPICKAEPLSTTVKWLGDAAKLDLVQNVATVEGMQRRML
jgi:hypothetical protein